jgi:hypothetical protein
MKIQLVSQLKQVIALSEKYKKKFSRLFLDFYRFTLAQLPRIDRALLEIPLLPLKTLLYKSLAAGSVGAVGTGRKLLREVGHKTNIPTLMAAIQTTPYSRVFSSLRCDEF